MANVGVYTSENGRVSRIAYGDGLAEADLIVDESELPNAPDLLGVDSASLFDVGGSLEYHPTEKRVAVQNGDVAGLKTFMKKRISRILEEKETEPVDYGGNTYPGGLPSQSRIAAVISAGEEAEANGENFEFDARDVNGTFHTLSLSDLKNLRNQYLAQVSSARSNAASLEQNVENASTVSDLQAIDVAAGW